MVKNLLLWAVIAVVLMTVFNNFAPRPETPDELDYSQFIKEVKSNNVRSVMISPDNRQITGIKENGDKFETNSPGDDKLLDTLLKYDVVVEAGEAKPRSLLLDILISWFRCFYSSVCGFSSCVKCKVVGPVAVPCRLERAKPA